MSKVSVIIPAYNKANDTERAVKSVISQTYKDIECIVVDDGSTDNTWEKVFPYETKGVRYIYQQNSGASSARNKGIVRATGEYIAFLDCDDYYLTDKIEKSVAFLELFKQYRFVHTSVWTMGLQDWSGQFETKLWLEPGLVEVKPKIGNLLFRNYIFNSTSLIKKEALDNVGLFDEDLFIAADWDMWLRLSEQKWLDHMEGNADYIGYLDMPLTVIEPVHIPRRKLIWRKMDSYSTLHTLDNIVYGNNGTPIAYGEDYV